MSTRYDVTKHFKRVNYAWEVYRLDETGGYTGEAVARCQDAKMAQLIADLLTKWARPSLPPRDWRGRYAQDALAGEFIGGLDLI